MDKSQGGISRGDCKRLHFQHLIFVKQGFLPTKSRFWRVQDVTNTLVSVSPRWDVSTQVTFVIKLEEKKVADPCSGGHSTEQACLWTGVCPQNWKMVLCCGLAPPTGAWRLSVCSAVVWRIHTFTYCINVNKSGSLWQDCCDYQLRQCKWNCFYSSSRTHNTLLSLCHIQQRLGPFFIRHFRPVSSENQFYKKVIFPTFGTISMIEWSWIGLNEVNSVGTWEI